MNKHEIRALFLAHGFQMESQPDGSTDFGASVYAVAQALIARFSDIYGHPVGNVEISAAGGAEARTAALFHDKAASIEFPVYIMRQPPQKPTLATSQHPASAR